MASTHDIRSDDHIAIDDFELDYHDLISSFDAGIIPSDKEALDSPTKKKAKRSSMSDIDSKMFSKKISLKPSFTETNKITNELFQVTSGLAKNYKNKQSNQGGNGFLTKIMDKRMDNKRLSELEQFDFELDDILRTRYKSARFKNSTFNIDRTNSPSDSQFNQFFNPSRKQSKPDEDQENKTPYPEPLKPKLGSNQISKQSLQKASKNISTATQIPALRPINQPRPSKIRREFSIWDFPPRSPKRICSPRQAADVKRLKPAIKHDKPLVTFLVESSSSLLSDATSFATELNKSNCEGFPFPEKVNEIVQIPASCEKENKKAIIRMIKEEPPKTIHDDKEDQKHGFYSEEEFHSYRSKLTSSFTEDAGVEVVSQPIDHISETQRRLKQDKNSKKTVKWAKNLEW
ncbi:uncharacterized protein J8A68_004017 [[Candida] subhashii]|uniref:Uncharacterized protein n=1 Tax=[Candida] subhashii TaxID=561895 RepID=A0A8J5QK70_9ASCO|nr:uncharacterized protein J8A68_004017 [[Candida] subhashii]KAG7662486.1 hypothetical protein J8A68_004017 [[Candida] subhashii]